VLAAAGPAVRGEAFPEVARLIDLAPTVLAAAGASASVRHGGSVLQPLVGERAAASAADLAPDEIAAGVDLGLNESEAEEVEEHLRGLGYLE